MHDKLKEVSRCVNLKKAGQRVAGVGKLAWKK